MSKKGSAYEREICKRLSEWWGNEDDIFWRTQSSGARATSRRKQGKKTSGQYGDICAVDRRGRIFTKVCTVSLKRGYQRTTMADLIDAAEHNREPQFADWVRRAKLDSRAARSIGWLLIVRRNRRKDLVFMNMGLAMQLNTAGAKLATVAPQIHFIAKIRKKKPPTKKQLDQMTAREILRNYSLSREAIFGCLLKHFLWRTSKLNFAIVYRRNKET
jgi:hypothetical protein